VARVNLDAAALQADDRSRELMSAQLVWTLKQLAEVQTLRITADGGDLGVPGVGPQQSRDAWGGYDPAGLTQGAIAYVVRGGRVGRVVDGRFTPVPGPAGDGRVPVVRPAVALDASQLAAVSPDGRRLLVGRLVEEGTVAVRLRGQSLSAPSWDPSGGCWVVDRADGQVWMLPAGRETPIRVEVPQVDAGPITALRVARDGTRVAVVAGVGDAARLFTAAVLVGDPGGAVRLGPLREVLPALRSVRDVAWSDATTLAVLGRQGEDLVAPLFTDTAGYQIASVESQPGLFSIAAAPPLRPVLAGTDKGRLWQYTAGRGWVSLGPGADPAYPG
jgi:hypothetical protein